MSRPTACPRSGSGASTRSDLAGRGERARGARPAPSETRWRAGVGVERLGAHLPGTTGPVLPGAYGPDVAISVVLAEDSLIVREGIQQILALEPGVEVVAACGDLPELMEAIEREAPEVVLTDIRMPPGQI